MDIKGSTALRSMQPPYSFLNGISLSSDARFWHIVVLKSDSRYHGVSGVGGSNPLVPTKKPQKNQPLKAGFFMPEICLGNYWGITGEKPPTIYS